MAGPTAAGRALLDTFPLIRIISLPDRLDRRREIAGEFARLGLAIDGGQVGFFDGVRVPDAAGFPTAGTRGCFLSHVGVLREATSLDASAVLLLEDDVDWSVTIERDLPLAMERLGALDWSIFYGGFLDRDGIPATSTGTRLLELAQSGESILGGHCVAFTQAAARAVVPYLTAMAARPPGSADGGPMHVDGAYGWFRRAHPEFLTAVAVPPLCHQRASRTDIHALGLKDRLPGLSALVALARRARRTLIRARR